MAEFKTIHEARFGGVTVRHIPTGQEAYIAYRPMGLHDQTHAFILPKEIGGEVIQGSDRKATRSQAIEVAKGLLRRQYREAVELLPLEVDESDDLAWRFPSAIGMRANNDQQ